MWTLGSILKLAVVAGLIAGAVISGFHTLLIEPYIERAIAIEEQHSQAHGEAHEEPVVDRPTQRWGLVLGFILYGAIWGLLLGVLTYLIQGWRPTSWTIVRYGVVLAVIVGWSVALFYHGCNGVRHLLWDLGYLLDLKGAYRAGYTVLAMTVLLTALFWGRVLI